MRGIIAAAGAVSVAAMGVAAPMPYTLAANVLTVTGYTFGGTVDWEMDEIFQGSYCSQASGNSCTAVSYNAGVSEEAEKDGLRALRAALGTTAPPTTVVAFSQGATIATHWLQENAGTEGAPAAEDLSFVLAANPKRKYGGIRSGFAEPTPNTEYEILDIAMEYDGAADFPTDTRNILALANALAGFAYLHIPGYNNIDLDTEDKLVWKEGNTTYVLIRRENLPLLEPLRMIGLGELADQLNGPLKAKIDEAYDRDYPGLVDPEDHDEVLQQALSGGETDEATVETSDEEPAAARLTAFTTEAETRGRHRAEDLETGSSTTDLDEDSAVADDDEDAPSDEAAEDDAETGGSGGSGGSTNESAESPDSESETERGATKADDSKPSDSDSDSDSSAQ